MSSQVRHRVSVVVENEGHILGFHAQDPHNQKKYFFLPGGMREEGETIDETACRETLEETGYSIHIFSDLKLFREYEFEWNGSIHLCQTWYLVGHIIENAPIEQVNDASYHLGVAWAPVTEASKTFSYHDDVLEPVLELLRKKGELVV